MMREKARSSLLDFTSYTKPDYIIGAPHIKIANALEAVERRDIDRLMLWLPPRHGKSELASKRWPARYMGLFPEHQFISASYGDKLATDFGRDVRNIIASNEYGRLYPNVKLAKDSQSKSLWHTTKGGVYLSASIGQGITGRGANILSIDDPFKDRAEADSVAVRENVWNWWTSSAYTRLMKSGAVVITNTRWHEDDLCGRILNGVNASRWTIVSMPAINDDGTALWPEWYPLDTLRNIETDIGARDWAALYMQDPRPLDGGLFKISAITIIDGLPGNDPAAAYAGPTWQRAAGLPQQQPATPMMRDGKPVVVRAWDLAATEQYGTSDPDWTVGLKLMRTQDDGYIVIDVKRLRGAPEDVEKAILDTAESDGKGVFIDLPQDPGQAGKSQVAHFTRRLSGFAVASSPETGSKVTRAAAIASQANVGNLRLIRAPWNATFIDELRSFPSGRKDDQVDALSRAFGRLTVINQPARRVTIPLIGR
jgi:predicted phage terminase large subunit-like protein